MWPESKRGTSKTPGPASLRPVEPTPNSKLSRVFQVALNDRRPVNPPQLEILAYDDTPLGTLCLRRRELLCEPGTKVTEVTLNHEFLMSSYLTASERALSDTALQMHRGPDSLKVLVGGLGLGYTAHAALTSDRIQCCDVIEFLPQVAAWLTDGLIPLSSELNADARLNVINGDVYAHLVSPPTQLYDLILIDVDHSPDDNLGDGNLQFYTEQGLQLAKTHLTKDGILGVWSYAESSPFVDALHQVFREVRVEQVTVFNNLINEEQTDWLFFGRD